MDLFVVERYNGDGPKADADVSASKSSHLQRLLSKIAVKQGIASKLAQEKEEKRKRKEEKEKEEQKKKAVKIEKQKQKDKAARAARKKGKLPDTSGQFTILGDASLGAKNSKVEAQLPHWLASPSIVSVDLQNLTVSIDDVPELGRDLIEKLRHNKITHFFPVQHQVIPCLLEAQSKPLQFWPRDLCVSAPTGSGKTIAFVLPIVQALRNRLVPHIRALVVLPVQNLATQVYNVFQEYSKDITDLKIVCTNGEESFETEQSQLVYFSEADQKLHSCADIVVTTPGRLVDHLQSTNGFSLHHLKYLVIDEADRVMESMQNDWLYHLENHLCPDERRVASLTIKDITVRRPPPQKLLFSATLSNDPEMLKELGLFQPRLFTSVVSGSSTEQTKTSSFVGKFTTPAELTEQWVTCDLDTKPLYLYHLISEGNWNTIIVFANTIESVHRLAILLKHFFKNSKKVAEVSSALDSKKRKKMLDNLASGAVNVLVCSDAFSRGIDIPNIDCVISYDAPKFVRNYIHRVGRTGRAGRQGTAITLVVDKQKSMFMNMLKEAGKEKVEEKVVDTSAFTALEDNYKSALTALKTDIVMEQENKKKSKRVSKPKEKMQLKKMNGAKKTPQEMVRRKLSKNISKKSKKNRR